jgi:acyl-CoA synthetase (NDP forming)
VVDINNPLDLTPMTGDAGYVQTVDALLEEPDIDTVLVGCIPFANTLRTLPEEDLRAEQGLVPGLIRLHAAHTKPWIAVVDAGPLYDPMARALLAAGIPTFRTADRALRLFNLYGESRQRTALLQGQAEPS